MIKNQATNLAEVKAHLENKVTDSGMVFSCELKDNGEISVTRKYISPNSLKYLEIGRDVISDSTSETSGAEANNETSSASKHQGSYSRKQRKAT